MKNLTVLLLISLFALVGCSKGPAERLGEDLDRAANDVGDAVEDVCEEVSDRPC